MTTRPADNTHVATRYAYAVDIRRIETGVSLGVALVVPASRYLSILAVGAGLVTTHELSDEIWREIEAWAAEGNARLPARPAPMSRSILAACLDGEQASAISAQRFAAIPIAEASHEALSRLADDLLPALLRGRRSAA